MRRFGIGAALLLATAATAATASTASASSLVDRNATGVKLVVTKDRAAHLVYSVGGKAKHVVAFGATNAELPDPARKQVSLKLNYSGGWGTRYYVKDPATLNDTCTPYDGPKLEWLVAACKAWDGTYWAVQSWQRALPNHGLTPRPENAVWELRLSHWQGPLPVVGVKADWAYGGRFEHLYGSFTYLGEPMHGFRTTTYGAPLDSWGVLVYLDTLNSRYGKGWKRAESFVTHNPTGIFCYVFGPHRDRTPVGAGTQYRLTVQGPGALPDVVKYVQPPGPWDRAKDDAANQEQRRAFSDKACRPS